MQKPTKLIRVSQDAYASIVGFAAEQGIPMIQALDKMLNDLRYDILLLQARLEAAEATVSDANEKSNVVLYSLAHRLMEDATRRAGPS